MSSAPQSFQRFILDQWSYLAHKATIGDSANQVVSVDDVPSWVPRSERRRLQAYLLYDSLRKNRSGLFLANANADQIAKHREYGDPSLITGRIAHGDLGDDWEIVVDGADDDLAEGPDLPDPPEPLPANATEGQRRVFAILKKRHAEDEKAAIDDWEERFISQPILAARQEEIREWSEHQGLAAKFVEGEDDCVTLGDTVYALVPQAGWPELRRYEPDAYFPILSDRDEGDPDKVHLAWGFDQDQPDGTVKQMVRRLTWELVDLDLRDGETGEVLSVGTGARAVPWSDEPVTRTCLFSEGVWSLEAVGPNGIPDLSEAAATWETDEQGEVRHRDLLIDEIPVVHIPNTPASRTHYGTSCLGPIAQVLDDLGQADTDLMETARLVAAPAIALSGAQSDDDTPIRPLTIFNLGESGQMTVLDLSLGLEKMMAFRDGLRDRALVNGHVPKALVGWTGSDTAPSGIAMLVDAAPFAQLIGTLRMTREPAHIRLLDLAQKMAMIAGEIDKGLVAPARVAYGNFLPLDRSQVVAEVTTLFGAKLITRTTAVLILMAAGFPIENARREVEQIELEDVERAKAIADATGDDNEGRLALGMEPKEQPAPPTVNLPPPPPQPPEPEEEP